MLIDSLIRVLEGPRHDPTRTVGLVIYLVASIGCFTAFAKTRRDRASHRWFWFAQGTVKLLFLLDTRFDWRLRLADLGRNVAKAGGWYAQRGPTQEWLLAGGVVVFLALLVWVRHRFARDSPATIALGGTALSLASRIAEVISWHDLDRGLYQSLGPLMVVGWAWLLGGLAIAIGAVGEVFLASRRKQLYPRAAA